jgi:hypothetical protein
MGLNPIDISTCATVTFFFFRELEAFVLALSIDCWIHTPCLENQWLKT